MTLHVLNTRDNIASPYKITEYDKKACELVVEPQPKFDILSSPLNGGVCLTKEDYNKVKNHIEAECINNRDNRFQE